MVAAKSRPGSVSASQRLREGSFNYLLLPSLVWTYFVLLLPRASPGESINISHAC